MIETELTETPVEEVVEVVEVPVVVEMPELSYTYQPKDEHGRAYGRPQVLKYRTQDELIEKLTDQNSNLVRELRKQTKKQRLGVLSEDSLPEGLAHIEEVVDFTPRELTADERYELSQDLVNPAKFSEATDRLFEATIGAKPAVLAKTISNMQMDNLRILAKTESDAFMANNNAYNIGETPKTDTAYLKCNENFDTIRDYMIKHNLAPVRQNFQAAYEQLMKDELILTAADVAPVKAPVVAPVVEEPIVEVVVEEPIVVEEPVIEPVAPKVQPKPKVSTGLTRRSVSEQGNVVKADKYTLQDINRMSSTAYKDKFLHEAGFRELVERLESTKKVNPNQR